MKTKTSSKQSSKTNTSNEQGAKATKSRTVGAHVPVSEQCEHKSAPHHSRGKCKKCYRQFRRSQAQHNTKLAKTWSKDFRQSVRKTAATK